MKLSARLFACAGILVGGHLLLRVLGCAEHVSAIAGMPIAPSSIVLGPLHLVFYLAAAILAPILMIAATAEALIDLRQRRSGERC